MSHKISNWLCKHVDNLTMINLTTQTHIGQLQFLTKLVFPATLIKLVLVGVECILWFKDESLHNRFHKHLKRIFLLSLFQC